MNDRDIPPDLTMHRRVLTISAGAHARAKLMAEQENLTVDDVVEGALRKVDALTVRCGLGELYELQEGNR